MDKRVLTALRTSVNCLCVLPAKARSLQSLAWLLPPWNASGEAGRSGSLHLLGFFWNGRLHVFRWRYNCLMEKEIFLRNMAHFQVLVPRTRRSYSFLSQRWNRVSTVVCCGPLLSFTQLKLTWSKYNSLYRSRHQVFLGRPRFLWRSPFQSKDVRGVA